MAHFARIDENNKVVNVLVTDNNDPAGDEGYSWLIQNLGGTWVKTSYNALKGKRINPETGEITEEPGFRKNYACTGMIYDEVRDAFYYEQPYPSWTLNEDTCEWEPPTEYPSDGQDYSWNEENQEWLVRSEVY
jgi:hypothetical protein